MTDPTKGLEAELASLRPPPLSSRVVDAIAEELTEPPLPFGDRCLLAVMSAGSLAACVIVGLLTWQMKDGAAQPAPSSPQQILAVQSPPPATIGQYQQLLAQSSSSSDAVPEILR